MTPELNRNRWDGTIYENKELGIEWGHYPLNYRFYDDDKVFPVEVDMSNKKIQAIQVGETETVTTYRGQPIGGDISLIVENGTHYVTGVHNSRVTRIDIP